MNLFLTNTGTGNLSLVGDDGSPRVFISASAGSNTDTVGMDKVHGNVLFCDSISAFITSGNITAQLTNASGRTLTAAEVLTLKTGSQFDTDADGVVDESENLNFLSKTEISDSDSPYTVLSTDKLVSGDASGGVISILLPAGTDGIFYSFKDGEGSAGTNNITLTPNGSETIEGAATYVIGDNFGGVDLYYDEATTDWKRKGTLGQSLAATGTPTFAGITVNGVGPVTLTPSAPAAGSATVGVAITETAGAGAAAASATAAANGGVANISAGAGGASDGTDAAGVGGAETLAGGVGGAANTAVVGGIGGANTVVGGAGGAGSAGAAGGAGGAVAVNGGAGGADGGGGAGADGAVNIAAADTSAVNIANATDNPAVNVLGSGDVSILGGGDILNPRLVQVVITATGGSGGATAGTLSIQVNDLAGTAVARAVKLQLNSSLTQFGGHLAATGTGYFGTATTGTLVLGSGALAALVTTDATGLYESAIDDAADETCWFSATTAPGGFANAAEGCVVVDCVPNDATWAA